MLLFRGMDTVARYAGKEERRRSAVKVVQKRIPKTVDVDFDRIPSHQSEAMCRTLIGCVSILFEDQAIKADYERWKQERQQRKEQTYEQ